MVQTSILVPLPLLVPTYQKNAFLVPLFPEADDFYGDIDVGSSEIGDLLDDLSQDQKDPLQLNAECVAKGIQLLPRGSSQCYSGWTPSVTQRLFYKYGPGRDLAMPQSVLS